MAADQDTDQLRIAKAEVVSEKHIRKVFLASILISVIALLTYVYGRGSVGGLSRFVRVCFPLLLLWSFMLGAYAFYAIGNLAVRRKHQLEEAMATDTKTGVKSLQYMRTMLQREYERAIEIGIPTAVIYVDLYNLDRVNKYHGHAVGDIALKGLAERIQDVVGERGVVGHLAGDEFAIVLPATQAEAAEAVVQAIVSTVDGYVLDLGTRGTVDFLHCTTGLVACPGDASFPDEILSLAQKSASPVNGTAAITRTRPG